MKSVLVATDFSEGAEKARHRAASVARETRMKGTLMHVLPASLPGEIQAAAAPRASELLARITQDMALDGLQFEGRLASGEVVQELAAAASVHDLVVAGVRGEGVLLGLAVGRTSTHLVRDCNRPTLIVKRPGSEPYRRVVAAIDFNQPALAAAQAAIRIAPNAGVHLVNAFEVDFESTLRLAGVPQSRIFALRRAARDKAVTALHQVAHHLALPLTQIATTAVRGYPPKVIVDTAHRRDAQLVVIGKHARGCVERLFVGSVAMRVLEMARCDVLVVPEMPA